MKKQNVLRILLFVLCAVLSLGFTVGAEEEAAEWGLANYDFDVEPSGNGVINEGTVKDGKLILAQNAQGAAASFYTSKASTTATQIKSEISVRSLQGWVRICFTNKVSAQGYQIQVRADGDVLLFGGPSNGYIDKIGSYDPTTFCKISFEMDLDEDVIRIAIGDAEAKEYNATMSAYYASNNYDTRGYSRVLVVGATPDASAEVDYIRVMSTAAPETEPAPTEPAPTEPETTTPATAAPEGSDAPAGDVTTGAQGGEEKPSNLGLIIAIVAAVVVVAVVVIVVIKKRK
ncbi:MAG: hypothetical protein E7630_01385 [Ruminococcaceae bacterium]|nr:hypothetical protein [Oscillospiraceae bacterium]